MSKFKDASKKIAIHLALVITIVITLAFLFLKVFLPSYTNHGQTVTVPDLEGYEFEQLDDFLKERNLRYEITLDSGFNNELKPLSVLKQNPKAGNKVKNGRKIYITLNAKNAPLIKMPNLVNSPLKNAQEIIANIGLVRGEIVYVPDIGINVVLEQKYRGRSIREGFEIPKGSQIDLVVGDGLGNQILDVPNLIGMDEVDGEFLIIGSGLRMGNINYVQTDSVPQGTIILQNPPAGAEVRTGDPIEVWISDLSRNSNF
ncbi:putative serine/threonine-protein kinase Sps1 [Indibacter alkaliphilus LW1]|jgi:beta-lactam-binding protein with PASTA domain|uniref:Serine/threonine-protein kinase Sps1 n=1 Tax=Indibacter alkaliphilus (strain CCUG 57479 / KCTC 22604 / LW1) TaxID=1189612 RepID=S2E1H2_INDAL|nr:PASTA domain-containing protein [Indibacter alkaliphilus]EOZ98311.1 putative serine/threonine-protein kinase Sps1 [Indibacter alkaliphilus LW1]